jgi:hypothetical protein
MVLRFLLALGALVVAAVFALAPMERQTVGYDWSPGTDGDAVPLVLIERTPDELDLRFPCPAGAVGFASARQPETVPALTVTADVDGVSATVADPAGGGPSTVDVELDETADDCEVAVAYDRAEQRLTVHAGDEVAGLTFDDDPFELTGLHWVGPTDGVRAQLSTTPFSGTRNSLLQRLLLLVVAGLALATALSLRRDGWRPRLRRPRRPHVSEWSLAAIAVVVAVVDLPRVDDGRILSRARLVSGTELPANVLIMYENRTFPQRWLYEWLLGTVGGWSHVVVVIRSLSVLAFVVAWVLLRRRVLPALVGAPLAGGPLLVAWVVQVAFVVAWAATVRPEPFVMALTVGVLAVIASWPRTARAWPYAVGVGCVGVALATHVVGVAAAVAAVPALGWFVRDLRGTPRPVLTGLAWGGAISLVAAFLGSNVRQSLTTMRRFRGDEDHGHGPLDLLAYLDQVASGTAPMMWSFALAVVALVVLLPRAARSLGDGPDRPADVVAVAVALTPLALLPTPSKWLWHLAILTPAAVAGWTLLADRARRPVPRPLGPVVALAAVLGLAAAWSLRSAWHPRTLGNWGVTALRRVTADLWASRVPALAGGDVRWWGWVLLLAAVGAGVVLWTRRRPATAGASSALAVAAMLAVGTGTVGVVQLAPPVADAVVSGDEWTFVRQSAVGIVSRDVACGVPAATPELRDRFAGRFPDGLPPTVVGNSRSALLSPCQSLMPQRDGVWQVPAVMLHIPQADQARVLLEYDAVPIGCNSFPRSRSGDMLCFSALEAPAGPLAPASVHWAADPW